MVLKVRIQVATDLEGLLTGSEMTHRTRQLPSVFFYKGRCSRGWSPRRNNLATSMEPYS